MKLSKNRWKNYSVIVSIISLCAIGGLSFFLIQAKQEVKSLQSEDSQQSFNGNGQMPSGERPSDMPSGGGPGEESTTDSSTSESSE